MTGLTIHGLNIKGGATAIFEGINSIEKVKAEKGANMSFSEGTRIGSFVHDFEDIRKLHVARHGAYEGRTRPKAEGEAEHLGPEDDEDPDIRKAQRHEEQDGRRAHGGHSIERTKRMPRSRRGRRGRGRNNDRSSKRRRSRGEKRHRRRTLENLTTSPLLLWII